jgi:hypothetical protein
MKKISLATSLFLVLLYAEGQGKKAWGFRSISSVGLVKGSLGYDGIIQTINGVYWKNWSAGLGVGLDYYSHKTIPLFFDLRRTLPILKNKTFLYADLGESLPPRQHHSEDVWYGTVYTSYDGGLYYDLGLGYAIPIGKKDLLLSLGYSQKEWKEKNEPVLTEGYYPPWSWRPGIEQYHDTYRRLSLKLCIRL